MSTSNEALSDEVISINSIYAEGTLIPTAPDSLIYSLRLPAFESVTLRIEFPPEYPDGPPAILGTQSIGDDVQKGAGKRLVEISREVLGNAYRPGEPCIFDLLEELKDVLEKAQNEGTLQLHVQQHNQPTDTSDATEDSATEGYAVAQLGPEPPWVIGPQITEKKSVFLARAAAVSSPNEAKSYVTHLLATDKKAAKATHNITAWRIRGANGATYQDCDDDGETAAGGRVLHLMQLMDVWDVMVVVTRWYGGIQLGPDRFRIINTAAREALVQGGFAKEGKDGGGTDGKKKGKR
jgi:uncharacterized protein (DUF1810 family)